MGKDIDYLAKLKDEYEQFSADRGTKLEVIPTGSISLDISTDIGGIARGKITMIYGPYSSAKTTLCLNIAKNAVDLGLDTMYVDAEHSVDDRYIREIVGELSEEHFKLYQPDTAETALSICEAGIRSGYYKLVILDSVGALAPEEELKKELNENSMTLVPRLLSKFLRRNAYPVHKNGVAFIFVNQVRANIKSYMGGYDVPGGNALKHFTAMWIMLSRGQIIKAGDEEIGIYSSFVIKKNKLGVPYRASNFPLIFKKGIDRVWNTIEFAEMLGILQKRGSFFSYEGQTLGHGLAKTEVFLKENPEILDKITKACYTVTDRIPVKKDVKGEDESDEED